jgi:hypothetical protein
MKALVEPQTSSRVPPDQVEGRAAQVGSGGLELPFFRDATGDVRPVSPSVAPATEGAGEGAHPPEAVRDAGGAPRQTERKGDSNVPGQAPGLEAARRPESGPEVARRPESGPEAARRPESGPEAARRPESGLEAARRPGAGLEAARRPAPGSQGEPGDEDSVYATQRRRPLLALVKLAFALALVAGLVLGGGALYLSQGGAVPVGMLQALRANPTLVRDLARVPGLERLALPAHPPEAPAPVSRTAEPSPQSSSIRPSPGPSRPAPVHPARAPARTPEPGSRPVSPPQTPVIELAGDERIKHVRFRTFLLRAPIPGGRDFAKVNAEEAFASDGYLMATLHLKEGNNEVALIGHDAASSLTQLVTFVVDTTAPTLEVEKPAHRARIPWRQAVFTGRVRDEHLKDLQINGTPIELRDGRFSFPYPITPGDNRLELVATDMAGNHREVVRIVTCTLSE